LRLEWSARAFAEREAFFRFVEAESPCAAALIDERIDDQVELLARFSATGAAGAGCRHAGTGDP